MDSIKRIEAFRDFFHYGTKEKMQEAYARITDTECGLTKNIDWEAEEFLFNRLFVGPASPEAPMTASVYLDPERHTNGRITEKVREIYTAAGLSLSNRGSIPEDLLPVELDACCILKRLAEVDENFIELYEQLTAMHMYMWIPLFTERAGSHADESSAVMHVLCMLDEWIKNEVTSLVMSKEKI